jgi:hypothetical protein
MSINLDKEFAFISLAKDEGLYPDEVIPHLQDLVKSGVALAPVIFEKLIEKYTGQKQLANESYRDFEDNSDAKTSCATYYMDSKGSESYKGCIGRAEHKIGYVRVAAYNGATSKIDFFLIPPINECRYNYQGSIYYNYNFYSEKYSNSLENYRKKTLKEVCANINRLKKAA